MGGLLPLIQVLGSVAGMVLNQVVKSKLPQEVIDASIAVVTAIDQLHDTAVTKAQLESLRG